MMIARTLLPGIIKLSDVLLDVDILMHLKDKRVDSCANHNHPIRITSEKGFTDIVQMLLND
ncbi:hypothetical protein BC833DRAFT_596919, partial [Globomyces pollinis-pini]